MSSCFSALLFTVFTLCLLFSSSLVLGQGRLPVRHYACEEAWQAGDLAKVLAEQEALARGWVLEGMDIQSRTLESCGLRSAEYLFFYRDEKADVQRVLVQRLEFSDETPLYIRFPRDCYCGEIGSWSDLAPGLLAMQFGEQKAVPRLEGGQCERPEMQYEDELLVWDEESGYFEIRRHWRVVQTCPNGGSYEEDQYLRGVLLQVLLDGSEEIVAHEMPVALTQGSDILPELKVFPNPSKNYLQADFVVSQSGEVYIELLDVMGVVCCEEKRFVVAGNKEEWRLGIADLPAGTYLLRLRSKGEKLVNEIEWNG